MVLEAIVKVNKDHSKSFDLFYVGVLFATVGTLLSLWTFQSNPSLVKVFFTTMIGIPLIYKLLKYEEAAEAKLPNEKAILKYHLKSMAMYFFLFLGIMAAYFLWHSILPDTMAGRMFETQHETINNLNANTFNGRLVQIFGGYSDQTGMFLTQDFNTYMKIVSNNTRVLIFSLIFSLVFGVGALFILVWNGSVLAAAYSHFFQKFFNAYILQGYNNISAIFLAITQSSLRYLVHGIPELTAYLIGGFAGGILSASIINGDYKTLKFDKILYDFIVLVTIAIAFVLVSAGIEVFITPNFFM